MNFGADLDLMECERAVQRGMVAAQDTGSGAHGSAFGEQTLPERNLLGAELGRSSEAHTLLSSGETSGAGALGD